MTNLREVSCKVLHCISASATRAARCPSSTSAVMKGTSLDLTVAERSCVYLASFDICAVYMQFDDVIFARRIKKSYICSGASRYTCGGVGFCRIPSGCSHDETFDKKAAPDERQTICG